nr:hypothetical protein C5F59_03310 [Streptomyces sp. QL37]
MRALLWRALLAPLTSVRAFRLWRHEKGAVSYDTAWREARMVTSPDEMVYRLHGHHPPPPRAAPEGGP